MMAIIFFFVMISFSLQNLTKIVFRFLGQLQRKKVVGQFFVSRWEKNEVSTSLYNDDDGKVKLTFCFRTRPF